MQGIELSRRFYIDVVRPWLDTAAPRLPHSAALIGYGSELLGFDDDMSRDHNWGPRVHLFLSPDRFDAHAHRLIEAFTAVAPARFLGEPIGWRSRPHPAASGRWAAGALDHGLEIHTIEARLEGSLALQSVDAITQLQWLALSEQRLLGVTAGGVFHDDDGRLGAVRAALAYFPRDVWLYKIACQWRRIAEEQAFVGRAGMVGDDIGSRVIAARLARDVMRLAFLLERRYAPYPKWFGSAFARLPIAAALSEPLQKAVVAEQWRERGEALAAAYLVLANRQRTDGVGKSFVPIIGSYHDRPFATINVDDIIPATLAAIDDPVIKALPVIGALDQVTDSTPVIEDPQAAQRMMAGLFG